MNRLSVLSSIPYDVSDETRNFLVQNDPHGSLCCGVSQQDDPSSMEWLIDSGASHHVTPNSSCLLDCLREAPVPRLQTADGTYREVKQMGCVRTPTLSIADVLHIPEFSVNILSVSQLAKQGYDIVFSSTGCDVQERSSKKIVGSGRVVGGVYVLTELHLVSSSPAAADVSSNALEDEDKSNGNHGDDGGEKFDGGPITVVYKLDFHCEGCVKNLKHETLQIEGVESVNTDKESNKLVVIGKVDPAALRARLEEKTKKKVELVSPQLIKDQVSGNKNSDEKHDRNKEDQVSGNEKSDEKHDRNKENQVSSNEKSDEKDGRDKEDQVSGNEKSDEKDGRHKEAQVRRNEKSDEKDDLNKTDKKESEGEKRHNVASSATKVCTRTTAIYKLHLHCLGCAMKLEGYIRGIEGVEEVKLNRNIDKFMVTGRVDPPALRARLEQKAHMKVELISPSPIKTEMEAVINPERECWQG